VITRRAILAGAPAVLLRGAPQSRTNLLFLLADDHASSVFGAAGNSLAQTPNLDRLAAQSMSFSQHFCNSPFCTTSRQSLLTGLMPYAAGVTRANTPLALDKSTVAKQLKKAGYRTAAIGKMSFNRPATAGMHGFELALTEKEITRGWENAVHPKPRAWKPLETPARVWLNASKSPYPAPDASMLGTYLASQAMSYLEQNRDKPFALWVSFMEPHAPFDFPTEDRDAFDDSKFELPAVGKDEAGQVPKAFADLKPQEKQGIAAAYYTSARFMDRLVGRVLDKLSELKLDENTLVVYSSDHGYLLGQHGRFEKECGFDPALRIPLLFRLPGRIEPGVVNELTEHLDIAPTLLEVLNAEPLPGAQGQSLRHLLEGSEDPDRRDHVVSVYLENEEVYVRTSRWKFIYGSGKRAGTGRDVRLFDLQADPGERLNIAAQHSNVVAGLQTLALARFRKTHPDGPSEPPRLARADALDFYLPPREP
jgi:arylsulfatase A-like enzyme